MQTAVEIDFQGMDAKLDIRTAIAKHVAQLEQRFGRVTAGRVVLKAPGGHHRTGDLYEVNIRSALPNAGKSISSAPQRRTSGIPTYVRHQRCVQAGRADNRRIVCARCRDR